MHLPLSVTIENTYLERARRENIKHAGNVVPCENIVIMAMPSDPAAHGDPTFLGRAKRTLPDTY